MSTDCINETHPTLPVGPRRPDDQVVRRMPGHAALPFEPRAAQFGQRRWCINLRVWVAGPAVEHHSTAELNHARADLRSRPRGIGGTFAVHPAGAAAA